MRPLTGLLQRPGRTVPGILAVTPLALLGGCATSSVDTQRLDEVFDAIRDDAPGCSAAVYDDDRVAWTGVRGLADEDDGILIDEGTLFPIGEAGQGFIATAVLLLAERDEIELDDPIRTHLPTLPAWADEVTVKHLLQRTSGVPDYAGLPGVIRGFYRVIGDDLLTAISSVDVLRFEPGSRFSGQWSDDVLQAFLVEAVTGGPLSEVLEQEVFRPAGIGVRVAGTVEGGNVAPSYARSRLGADQEADREEAGDVGIYSTATDLSKWGSQYWNPTVGGVELLEQRTAHMVVATDVPVTDEGPPVPGGGDRGGAGVFGIAEGPDTDIPGFLALGSDLGFRNVLFIASDERVSAAVICSEGAADPVDTLGALFDAYLADKDS